MTDFEYYEATIILAILGVPVLLWVILAAYLLMRPSLDERDHRERRNRR